MQGVTEIIRTWELGIDGGEGVERGGGWQLEELL